MVTTNDKALWSRIGRIRIMGRVGTQFMSETTLKGSAGYMNLLALIGV